jgi:hypothetical protein
MGFLFVAATEPRHSLSYFAWENQSRQTPGRCAVDLRD